MTSLPAWPDWGSYVVAVCACAKAAALRARLSAARRTRRRAGMRKVSQTLWFAAMVLLSLSVNQAAFAPLRRGVLEQGGLRCEGIPFASKIRTCGTCEKV